MNFQRLLTLCDILQECEKLPAGVFRLWARATAIREIAEVLMQAGHTRFYVCGR